MWFTYVHLECASAGVNFVDASPCICLLYILTDMWRGDRNLFFLNFLYNDEFYVNDMILAFVFFLFFYQ